MVATPAMPTLSAAEVAVIKANWEVVKGHGVDVLYNFLSKYPENQSAFKAFAGKDLASLKSKVFL